MRSEGKLTEDKKTYIINYLKKNNIISGSQLAEILEKRDLDIRIMIAQLRNEGYPIIANNKGYSWAKEEELKKYVESRKKELSIQLNRLNKMEQINGKNNN